ncbi:MAG: R3H domain-containing nucleic acid-binding protein [Patescibacteria group bacterium]
MNELVDKIKNFSSSLLSVAGFTLKSIEAREEDQTVKLDIFIENAGLVIGENGENLFYWEAVLSQWARQQFDQEIRVIVDINNYRWQHEQRLRELAKKSARQVVLSKNLVKLQPMSSYERRVIHTELALHPGVATESEGEGRDRRVVIRPL